MKTSTIKCAIFAVTVAITLAACGGGGDKGKKPVPVVDRAPIGFANIDGSCYLNVALQLIANDPRLRKEVIGKYKYMKWEAFFDAYDGKASAEQLKLRHEALIADIRKLDPVHFAPNVPGYASAVLRALQIELTDTTSLDTIKTGYAQGKKNFDTGNQATQGTTELVKFSQLPLADKLNGFVYFQGAPKKTDGHFIVFVRKDMSKEKGATWFEINDDKVKEVDVKTLENLPRTPVLAPDGTLDVEKSTGINIVSYK